MALIFRSFFWMISLVCFLMKYNEALLTLNIMRGNINEELKKYPHYVLQNLDVKWLSTLRISEEKISTIKNIEVGDWSDSYMFACQNLAHEILVSKDSIDYYQWIDFTEPK